MPADQVDRIDLDTICDPKSHDWEYIRLFWTIYRCRNCGLTGDIGRVRFEAQFESKKEEIE